MKQKELSLDQDQDQLIDRNIELMYLKQLEQEINDQESKEYKNSYNVNMKQKELSLDQDQDQDQLIDRNIELMYLKQLEQEINDQEYKNSYNVNIKQNELSLDQDQLIDRNIELMYLKQLEQEINDQSELNFSINDQIEQNNDYYDEQNYILTEGILDVQETTLQKQQIKSINLKDDNGDDYDDSDDSDQDYSIGILSVPSYIQSNDHIFIQGKFLKQYVQAFENIDQKLLKIEVMEYLTSGGEGDIFLGRMFFDFWYEYKFIILKIQSNQNQKQYQEELDIINSIKNPINIIKIIDDIRIEKHQISIQIIEKCKFSLWQELQVLKAKPKFTINHLYHIIFDLLDGLIEIRSHNIIHQDIKPQNILKTYQRNFIYTDFGCASWQYNRFKKKGYSKYYASPEQKDHDGIINYKSDVYCLGKTFEQIIQCFKEINQQNDNYQPYIYITLLDIVKRHMIQEKNQDREDVINLLLMFYQSINQFKYEDINKRYNKKLLKIIDQDPFNNDKDIPYFSYAHLQYCLIYFHTELILSKKKEVNIFDTIKFGPIQMIQNVSIMDQQLIISMKKVGLCYLNLRQYQKALAFFQQSLEMNKIIIQGNNSSIADSLNSVGLCYRSLGLYRKSLNFYLQSLQMNKIIFQGNHFTSADSLNNVGLCYQDLGQYEKALDFLLQSLEMKKKIYKGNHSTIADSLNDVGLCYRYLGQYQTSLNFLSQSLEMKKVILEGNHSTFAESLNNIGLGYRYLGQYQEALDFSLQSLDMKKMMFKGNHSNISDSLSNVGQCYRHLGKYEIALNFQLQSLEMNRIIYQWNHCDIIKSLYCVGQCYLDLGQYAKAMDFLHKFIKLKKIIFRGNHSYITDTFRYAGQFYKTRII